MKSICEIANEESIEVSEENNGEEKWRPIKISKSDLINSIYPELEENLDINKFSDSKFGTALLKKWGWKGEGHGIGKEAQGIAEPICYQIYSNRQGLGSNKEMIPFSYAGDDDFDAPQPNVDITKLKDKALILKDLRKFLQKYLHSKCLSELEFDTCFSNEERRLIHLEAHSIGLKTQSVGVREGRYLTLNKKRSPIDILEEIQKNSSGQFGKYKLLNNN